jgi:hypothetical protein
MCLVGLLRSHAHSCPGLRRLAIMVYPMTGFYVTAVDVMGF